jgi:hypothetical protein
MSSLYRRLNTLNTAIFVDLLSALQAIKGSIYKVKNYIIYDIYNSFTSLSNIGINVILEWIDMRDCNLNPLLTFSSGITNA